MVHSGVPYIFERRRGPQTSRGPGSLPSTPPLDGPDYKLFTGVNIDDLEWPWTFKIGVLVAFLQFVAAT